MHERGEELSKRLLNFYTTSGPEMHERDEEPTKRFVNFYTTSGPEMNEWRESPGKIQKVQVLVVSSDSWIDLCKPLTLSF